MSKVEVLFEKRFSILLGILALTLIMGYFAKNVGFKTEYNEMLPPQDRFVQTHLAYESQYGGPLSIRVILEMQEGTIFTSKAINKIKQITDALDATPGVNHDQIFSLTSRKVRRMKIDAYGAYSVPLVARDKPLPKNENDLRKLALEAQSTDGVIGTYVSFDKSSAYFQANLIPHEIDYPVVFEHLRTMANQLSDETAQIHLFGQPVLTGWIYTYNAEIIKILAVSFFLMLAMLLYSSGNLSLVLLAGAASLVSAIWGLGFVGILGWTMDPLILVIPMLVMARTLSHSVQMGLRYVELCKEKISGNETVILLFKKQFKPGLLGIVTDAAGIFLIGVADIPIMKKLAIFSGVWSLSVVVTVLVMIPLLLSYMKPGGKGEREISQGDVGVTTRFLGLLFAMTGTGGRRKIAWSVILLILGTTIFISKDIAVGELTPGTSLLWPDSDYNKAVNLHASKFVGPDELLVIMESVATEIVTTAGTLKNDVRNLDVIKQMRAFQKLMDESTAVKGSLSYVDFLPGVARSLSGNYPKFEVLPRDQQEAGHITHLLQAGAAPGDFDHFFERDYNSASIRFFVADHRADTVNQVVDQARVAIDKVASQDSSKYGNLRMAAGSIGLASATNKEIARAQTLNFVLTLAAIVCFIWWGYRTFSAVVILLIPLLFTNVVVTAIMVKMGISFNINTLPILSVGMGVGIDYGIYLLSRAIEEGRGGTHRDLTGAIEYAVSTSGRAILITAITMVVAVGAWYFMSNLRFQADMGLLLALVMLINCLGALILIPLLLTSFRPKILQN